MTTTDKFLRLISSSLSQFIYYVNPATVKTGLPITTIPALAAFMAIISNPSKYVANKQTGRISKDYKIHPASFTGRQHKKSHNHPRSRRRACVNRCHFKARIVTEEF